MLTYLLHRMAGALFVVLAATFLAFGLLSTAPGDAAAYLSGDSGTAGEQTAIRASLGLDAPLYLRYASFVKSLLLEGSLGNSLISGRPVLALLGERLGTSFLLAALAFSLAVILGMIAGTIAAAYARTWFNPLLTGFSGLGLSIPPFWLALLLISFFSLRLGWLPVAGADTPLHYVLPVLCLTAPTAAIVARLTRASLLDASRQEYVRTARAKGLTAARVWGKHIFRNGLIPVVTVLSLHLGHLLGGTFVIETLFALPGLGRLVVQAIFERDTPVVLGTVLLMVVLFQVINIGVDILHGLIDPRLRGEML